MRKNGTDLFPHPYQIGMQYCFMRKNYKVNLVWNYKARLYAEPYEKDSDYSYIKNCSMRIIRVRM